MRDLGYGDVEDEVREKVNGDSKTNPYEILVEIYSRMRFGTSNLGGAKVVILPRQHQTNLTCVQSALYIAGPVS